ncbi:AAA family ATPase [Paraburkholderia sp. JPY419]|uniref:AAA family ATPase n=1 Tax=Paraburkholderia sp. JPY419 TaxID=667660 RepID=UPI003D2058F6
MTFSKPVSQMNSVFANRSANKRPLATSPDRPWPLEIAAAIRDNQQIFENQGARKMLIVFGGLPGTGKTTVGQTLARKLAAAYLRIDTLEQAFLASGVGGKDVGPAGYLAGYAVAKDNLRLGLTVVADSVNPLHITRSHWRGVALEAGARVFEIELICSDTTVHRLRVEGRRADISGHNLPTWKSVLERRYDAWESEHLVVDTATVSVEQAVETITRHVSTSTPQTGTL